jgi:hypothetical protein
MFKRSATEGALGAADYPDYQSGVRYDEYPVSTNNHSKYLRIDGRIILK